MSEPFFKLVSALIATGDVRFLIEHPELADYAKPSAIDNSLYALLDNHVTSYGKVPAPSTIVAEWGEALPAAEEAPLYYLKQMAKAHIRKTLTGTAVEANVYMKDDPEKSLELMEKACTALRTNLNALSIIDYRKAAPYIQKHLKSKWEGGNFISMGWPSFDKNSGGLMAGDFISLIGFTGAGKTQMLLSRAMHSWQELKLPTVFISGEMNLAAILERMVALDSHIPADFFKHGLLPTVGVNFKKKLATTLANSAKAKVPLHFIDANLAMREADVLKICNQLHPAILYIDGGANMGGTSFIRKWESIAGFASFVKQQICQRMGIPSVVSYQFSNEARKEFFKKKKKKDGQPPNLTDIAGSGEIANLSSVCLGMTPEDTPEMINRRKILIMKGRGGEAGSFSVNWNWNTMDFNESIDPKGNMDEDGDDELEIST